MNDKKRLKSPPIKTSPKIKKTKSKLNKLVNNKEDLLTPKVRDLSEKLDRQVLCYMKFKKFLSYIRFNYH